MYSSSETFKRSDVEETLSRVFLKTCEAADSPFSLGAWLVYKYGGPKGLSLLDIDPSRYDNSYTFSLDYLVYSFFRKLKPFEKDPSLRTEALRAFVSAEAQCEHQNELFRLRSSGREIDPLLESFVSKASQFIGNLLPSAVSFQKTLDCRFGPGSTYSLKGEEANWGNKLCEERITCTAEAFPYVRRLFDNDFSLFEAREGVKPDGPFCFTLDNFRVVQGSRLITVPKSSKTDRSICVEPSANIMLQKGIGRVLRQSLRSVGVNLNSQTKNQVAASRAQKAQLATIDLKSASDTMCFGVVLELLPPEWVVVLDSLRSKSYEIEGSWYDFKKFSAMGNGFTFELESLIFYALCVAVVPKERRQEISVFGDDIVLPQEYSESLIKLLAYVGFAVNKEKSFTSGRFFESCGKHYFDGFDVTPIYQKEIPNDEAEIYRMANRIYRFCLRQFGGGPDSACCPKALQRTWRDSFRLVKLPILIPLMEEDIGLIHSKGRVLKACELKNNDRRRRPLEGDVVFGLLPFPKTIPVGDVQALAYTFRFSPGDPVTGLLSVRSDPRYRYGYRRVWTAFGGVSVHRE